MGFDNGGSSLSCVPLESVSVCFPPLFLLLGTKLSIATIKFNDYINYQYIKGATTPLYVSENRKCTPKTLC